MEGRAVASGYISSRVCVHLMNEGPIFAVV